MKLPRWLREPAIVVALIGLPVGATTLIVGDYLDDRNAIAARDYEAGQKRCDRAFGVAQDESLNANFATDPLFIENQKQITTNCSR